MGFTIKSRQIILPLLLLILGAAPAVVLGAAPSETESRSGSGNLGTIRGVVRDQGGSPIADATVAIFRAGTTKLLKQVTSAADGRFVARIIPGTYTVLAVAQGFNPVSVADVSVARAADLSYGFNLERAGGGNTLPEKRLDRNSSKWRIRAAQMQRAIYQNRDGSAAVAETEPVEPEADRSTRRPSQTVVETYFGGTSEGNTRGVNFATLLPVGDDSQVLLAGQTGVGKNAALRLDVGAKFRPSESHQFRINTSAGKLGRFVDGGTERTLGQASVQVLDEWRVRDDLILVVGFDYAKFFGAGNDASVAPRLGLQYDVDAKTRFRSAFTTQTDEKSWARAIELEGEPIAFAEPVAIEDLVVQEGKPQMNKSRRLEFGVERLLSDRSSIEANVFFDTTFGRGVGLSGFAVDDATFDELTANLQGPARGLRVVYTRRITGRLTTSAGYSFGNAHKLAPGGLSDPFSVFEADGFQSFFGQVSADFKTGTTIRTIYRLSPQATVFAIDPFKGRLAIYDPGLSVYVTQKLPNWGFPFHAQAVVDARNLLDHHTGIFGEEGSLRMNAYQRMVRGAIQVRF